MKSLRYQLDQANKRIVFLETQINSLESIALGRVSPEMFCNVLKTLANLISSDELADILTKKESLEK